MRRHVEPRRNLVSARDAVQERGLAVPQDLAEAVVLHHEDPGVVEPVGPRLPRGMQRRRGLPPDRRARSSRPSGSGASGARSQRCLRKT